MLRPGSYAKWWIRMLSYNLESSDLPSPLGVKAHSTQGDAAGWSTPLTFIRFTTWICEPLLARLFSCLIAFDAASRSFREPWLHTFTRRFYPKRLTVHSDYTFFCQYMCSLGIEPTTFALLTQCSNHWATGTYLCNQGHSCAHVLMFRNVHRLMNIET